MTRASGRLAVVLAVTVTTALACGPPTSGTPVAKLWRENCARCHGPDGHGAPAIKGIDPKVDLTQSTLAHERMRGLLYQRIAYGYGSMPGFAQKMPQGDIEELVDLVTHLAAR